MVRELRQSATADFFWQLVAGDWNVRAVSRNKLVEQKITVETMSN